ncbi:hypothetical protein JTB14_006402 [Gonioctena quinquepunctata]|nr:hypothetical protein JTB14_006402 [Gonioctena quinquepunctata]
MLPARSFPDQLHPSCSICLGSGCGRLATRRVSSGVDPGVLLLLIEGSGAYPLEGIASGCPVLDRGFDVPLSLALIAIPPVDVDGLAGVADAATRLTFLLRLSDVRTLVLTFTFSRVRARSATFGKRRRSPNVAVTIDAEPGLGCSGEPVGTGVADPKEEPGRGGGRVDPRFESTTIGVDEVGDPVRKSAGVDGVADDPKVDPIHMGGEGVLDPRRGPPGMGMLNGSFRFWLLFWFHKVPTSKGDERSPHVEAPYVRKSELNWVHPVPRVLSLVVECPSTIHTLGAHNNLGLVEDFRVSLTRSPGG